MLKGIIKDFVSVRSVITLGAFLLLYNLIWVGRPVPDVLLHLIDILLGFWFGQKVGSALQKAKEITNGGQ